MTDEELIARLRKGDTPMSNHYMEEAADRIEALTKERDEAVHLARMRKTFTEEARDERDAAEAKLAKAVEALKDMCLEFRQADLPYGSAAYAKATATLAAVSETHKIKGESND